MGTSTQGLRGRAHHATKGTAQEFTRGEAELPVEHKISGIAFVICDLLSSIEFFVFI